ncbi:MAG: transglycosylase SLT domain-containing protein [Betaproteobacteria bacterium]
MALSSWAFCAMVNAADVPVAAERALVSAPSELTAQAVAYEHGEGVPKDLLKAAALYCEAARDGDPDAQYGLGWMFANGRGVARDDAIAASFFALAASAGHAGAQKALAFVGEDRGLLPGCMHRPDPTPPPGNNAATADVDPFADLPAWKQKIADQVAKIAPRYAIDTRLALAVIAVESNFEPTARSPKNARGLMQLIPETAARFNVKDSYDVSDNVRGGLAYLRWLLAYYKGYVVLAAAAYNAGEATVDRYQGIPPYLETREYVRQVLRLYGNTQHAYDPRIVKAASFLPASDKPAQAK